MNNYDDPQIIGAKPAYITWKVVRGDTATIMVQFLENDEVTSYDTTGWTYVSKAYDSNTSTSYNLLVEEVTNGVKITASSDITATWGTAPKNRVAELSFDLQVTIDAETVWTPILGNISVLGDVPGTLV